MVFTFFFSLSLSPPLCSLPKAPPPEMLLLSGKHYSMEYPVPQLLEAPTKTWKLICISRRNVSAASCLTQMLHLQEQVLPLGEISKASLPRVNLRQSQRSAPHPVISCTLHLPQGEQQLPLPTELLLRQWLVTAAQQVEEASAQSGLQHKHAQRKRSTQHVIRMFKGWQNNAGHIKDKAVCNATEYYPISQPCLYNNIQNRCSLALVPSTCKLHSKQGLHKLGRQILYHSHFCSVDWLPHS